MDNVFVSTLVEFLHMMATVAWIGGMIVNFTIVLPSMAKALDPPTAGKFMGIMMKKYRVMVYLALVILILSGFALTGSDDDFGKYFVAGEKSTTYFAIKHIAVFVMLLITVIAFEFVAPNVAKTAAAGPSPKLAKMQARQKLLGMCGLLVGLIVIWFSVML